MLRKLFWAGLVIVAVGVGPKAYSMSLSFFDFRTAEARVASAIEKRRTVLDLSDLTNLTKIPDSVRNISGLWWLEANNTKIADIGPVTTLPDLKNLYLVGTRVVDLSPLAGHGALEELDIRGSWAHDLQPLTTLPRLKWLQMNNTAVKSLQPLTFVRRLQWLNLRASYAEDGSRQYYDRLKQTVAEIYDGKAFQQNYIPDAGYNAKIRWQRFLQEWEWR